MPPTFVVIDLMLMEGAAAIVVSRRTTVIVEPSRAVGRCVETAWITAIPGATAVTKPVAFTVATLVFDDENVTAWFVVPVTIADNCSVLLGAGTLSVAASGWRLTSISVSGGVTGGVVVSSQAAKTAIPRHKPSSPNLRVVIPLLPESGLSEGLISVALFFCVSTITPLCLYDYGTPEHALCPMSPPL